MLSFLGRQKQQRGGRRVFERIETSRRYFRLIRGWKGLFRGFSPRKVEIPRILETSRSPQKSIRDVLVDPRSPFSETFPEGRSSCRVSKIVGGDNCVVPRPPSSSCVHHDFLRTMNTRQGKNLHEIEIPRVVGVNFIRVDEIYVASNATHQEFDK